MIELQQFPADNADQYLVKLAHINTRLGELQSHGHIFAELVVALSGHALNIIDGRRSVVLPGDVYVLLPGMRHEQQDMENYRFCIFKFDYEALLREAGELRDLPGFQLLFVLDPLRPNREENLHPVLEAEARPKVEQLTAILERELREKPAGYEAVSRHLFLALVTILAHHCGVSGEARRYNMHLIADAMGYMERHYMEALHIDELAARACYSRRHFTRLFRAMSGMSVSDYLTQIRLRHVCGLLAQGDRSVAGIAQDCGFTDAAALCRCFKLRYGQSPQRYRAALGGAPGISARDNHIL